jgi:murein DD-endopeptidase MepM/ murein hydrolase activator NlpD
MASPDNHPSFLTRILTTIFLKPFRWIATFSPASFIAGIRGLTAKGVIEWFENSSIKFKKLLEQARHTHYRIGVMNVDTFEEVGAYKLSLMNFYTLVSSIFVANILLFFILFMFTPLKRIIPGFAGGGTEGKVWELMDKVEKQESQLRALQTYNESARRMITGKVQSIDEIPIVAVKPADSTAPEILPSEDINQLKLMQENGGVANTSAPDSNDLKSFGTVGNDERLEQMYLLAPVKGDITLGYSMERKHLGVDIIAPKNTAVKAVADGNVISSDWTLETGNTIAIQHANNVVSFYKHNSVLLKKPGDKVKVGEAVAIIGNTGEQTSGPHLHFEIWKDGRPVNPKEYISF